MCYIKSFDEMFEKNKSFKQQQVRKAGDRKPKYQSGTGNQEFKKQQKPVEKAAQGPPKNDAEVAAQTNKAAQATAPVQGQKTTETPAQPAAQTKPQATTQADSQKTTQATAQTKPEKPAGLNLKELTDGSVIMLKWNEEKSILKLSKTDDKFKIIAMQGEFGLEKGDIMKISPDVIGKGKKCLFTNIVRGDKKLGIKGKTAQFLIDQLSKVLKQKAKPVQGSQKPAQTQASKEQPVSQNASFKYDAYGKIKING